MKLMCFQQRSQVITEKIQPRSLIAQPQFPFCLLSEDAIWPVIFCCISLLPTVVDSVSFKGKSKQSLSFLSRFLSAIQPHHSKINYQVCNWKADGKRILFDFWYKQQDRKDEKVKIHNVQTFLLSWVLFPAHWFIGRNYLGLDQSPSCRICSQSP